VRKIYVGLILKVEWVAYPDVGFPGGLPAHDLSPRRQIGAVGELRQHFRLSLHHFEANRYYIIEAVSFSYRYTSLITFLTFAWNSYC